MRTRQNRSWTQNGVTYDIDVDSGRFLKKVHMFARPAHSKAQVDRRSMSFSMIFFSTKTYLDAVDVFMEEASAQFGNTTEAAL